MIANTVPQQRKRGLLLLLGAILLMTCGVAALMIAAGNSREVPEITLTAAERDVLLARTKSMIICPKVGVGPIRLGMKPEKVIAALGSPERRLDDGHQTTLHYRRMGLCLVFGADNALRSIICMSDSRETWSSRQDKPPLTFAGSTEKGIRVGSTFDDVTDKFGPPNLSLTHANLYGPGEVAQHAFFDSSLWTTVKDGRVIEMSINLPGWMKPPADAPKDRE
jgi:hypothetical protein